MSQPQRNLQQAGEQAQRFAATGGQQAKNIINEGQTQLQKTVNRPYQVIVWGATGFTGKLVCENLAKRYRGEFSWAMAGRNESKLAQVRAQLEEFEMTVRDVPLITANLDDPESLDKMTSQGQVIINTVGPYAKYGTPIVESCVRQSTNHVDLTGEVQWVKGLIDKYHEEAYSKKIKIVNTCGFEVVPMESLTYLVNDHAIKKYGVPCDEVIVSLEYATGGGVSGGTLESIAPFLLDKKLFETFKDVYCLVPKDSKKVPVEEKIEFRYEKAVNGWVVTSPQGVAENRLFRRTNYLTNYRFGTDVQYSEVINTRYFPVAFAAYSILKAGIFALTQTPLWSYIRGFLPSPGSGPSRFTQMNSSWSMKGYGVVADPTNGSKNQKIIAQIKGNHDPGYYDTSIMLLETALALVLNKDQIASEKHLPQGGVLTPASAAGSSLINRLNGHDIKINIIKEEAYN